MAHVGRMAGPIATNAFNRGQYAISPGVRAYRYAELAVSSLAVTEIDHRQYSLPPTYRRMARLSRPGWPGYVRYVTVGHEGRNISREGAPSTPMAPQHSLCISVLLHVTWQNSDDQWRQLCSHRYQSIPNIGARVGLQMRGLRDTSLHLCPSVECLGRSPPEDENITNLQ